jgi:hypothetical protein
MQRLTRSLTFHLLMPYVVHLALAFLVIRNLSAGELAVILLFGGWIALLGISLIGIPFGMVHVLQAIYFGANWANPRKQFMVGLLNPSFAAITIAAFFYLAPKFIL